MFSTFICLEKIDEYSVFQCDEVDPADVTKIATTVKRAIATFGTPALKEMIQNCMAQDLSWKVSIIITVQVAHPTEKILTFKTIQHSIA